MQSQQAKTKQQKRSALDPCFSGRRRARADPSSSCQPTIMSHRMFHRHPSLSIGHFHFPSLSDSNPFPWLDAAAGSGDSKRRLRRDSVFVSVPGSWDSVIDRHLCNPATCGAGSEGGASGRHHRHRHQLEGGSAGATSTATRYGLVCGYLDQLTAACLAEEDDEGEDDVFQQKQQQPDEQEQLAPGTKPGKSPKQPQQQQPQQQPPQKKKKPASRSRDPRWRESVADAVRREFDPAASRRAHRDSVRVQVEPPPAARRRLDRLLGDGAGRLALLCDREYAERLAAAIAERARVEAAEREARLAEGERLRLLRLL